MSEDSKSPAYDPLAEGVFLRQKLSELAIENAALKRGLHAALLQLEAASKETAKA